MEDLAVLFDSCISEHIVLWDLENRRFEGIIEKVFKDFVQIFETKQRMMKIFRFDSIKNFEIGKK